MIADFLETCLEAIIDKRRTETGLDGDRNWSGNRNQGGQHEKPFWKTETVAREQKTSLREQKPYCEVDSNCVEIN